MPDLNHRIFGEPGRPAVVLLHGLFGSSSNWGSIARHLAPRYHVLVPDLRNHGQSAHHATHSYREQVDDVLSLLDRTGIASARFVGHSMGGKVAMLLALLHPARVRALAVVDMAPIAYTHDFNAVLAGFNAVDLQTIGNRAEAERQMAGSVTGSGVRAFLLQNLVKGEGGWTWRLNLDALRAAQSQITGFPELAQGTRYEGPTAFIYGELSDYVKRSYRPRIMQLFPAAKMTEIAEAGHWVYADQAQRFLACLDPFLDNSP